MSLWFFLSEWFSGATTWGSLFKRSMVNACCAIGLLFVLLLFSAPADVAFAVILAMFVLNGVMTFCFLQQRR
jgi:O-antigen/teichoic acid export membrane protein